MQTAVDQISTADRRDEASAYLEQGRDFFLAASSGRLAANPLLYYYSMLNLGKVLLCVRDFPDDLARTDHGLGSVGGAPSADIETAEISVSGHQPTHMFEAVGSKLGFANYLPGRGSHIRVRELLPQNVLGHRLWRTARESSERFVGLSEIEFIDDRRSREFWLRMYVRRDELTRHNIVQKHLITRGGLAGAFHLVKAPLGKSEFVCIESDAAVAYTHRPSDQLLAVVESIRPQMWRIVTSTPEGGYRKCYLHLDPEGATGYSRMPQLLSTWAIFFYLGSIVRYKPHVFDEVLMGRYGPFVSELIASQPAQFVYLIASEMVGREVARPAIV